MVNKPQKKSGQKAGAEASTAAHEQSARASGLDKNVRRSLDDACYNYMQDVREAWEESQKRAVAANETYLRTQQAAFAEAQKRVVEAQKTCVEAIQDAKGKEDEQKLNEEAQRTFAEVVGQAREDAQKSSSEAYEAYQQALKGEPELENSLQRSLEKAYRSYAKAIQQTWAPVDITSLDPESLSAFSDSVASVAMYARNISSSESK
jgi:hypothetical protein